MYIKAKAVPKYRDANVFDLRISEIQYMENVKQTIDHITIFVNLDSMNIEVVDNLVATIEDSPGETPLFVQLIDLNGNLRLRAKEKRVKIDHKLLQFVEQTEGLNYSIN